MKVDRLANERGNFYTTKVSKTTENNYYYNVLFTMGDKCECLEPLHIREEIKRRIHDIAVLYEK